MITSHKLNYLHGDYKYGRYFLCEKKRIWERKQRIYKGS